MAQKAYASQNKVRDSKMFGKWYMRPSRQETVTSAKVAQFIQEQCSVKESDILATLNEVGKALKHFFELGYRVELTGLGAFKTSFSSAPANTLPTCTVGLIKTPRVIFQPERELIKTGITRADGTMKSIRVAHLVRDIEYVEDEATRRMKAEAAAAAAGGGE